jgi:hypothetical protein
VISREAPAVEDRRTCRSCGGEFAIKPGELAFFAAQELCLPKHCPACRARRHEVFPVHEQLRGVVELANDQFGFISCEDGRVFYFLMRVVSPHDLPLRPGDPVLFTADRQPPWRPGRRPNARSVRRRDR